MGSRAATMTRLTFQGAESPRQGRNFAARKPLETGYASVSEK